MDKVLILLGTWVAVILYILLTHIPFDVCLSDDIEFNSGKKTLRNRRKKNKTNFFVKFTFWDFRNEVVKWHYIVFWINLISNIIIFLLTSLQVVFQLELLPFFISCSATVSIGSFIIILPVRFRLYKYNRVRKRK